MEWRGKRFSGMGNLLSVGFLLRDSALRPAAWFSPAAGAAGMPGCLSRLSLAMCIRLDDRG